VTTEAVFQAEAEGYCRAMQSQGLLWHHCAEPRRCRGSRGWPDLFAAGPRGLLLAELKGPRGRRSPAQVQFGYTLLAARVPYELLEPGDWPRLGRLLGELL
jgi:hypothetical protein